MSFDDALRCQFDVAFPVLERRHVKAFFFVYSSPLCGDPDTLELYRYFRTVAYEDVDQFYSEFFEHAKILFAQEYDRALAAYDGATYLAAFPFYSAGDRWFRYLRDQVLGKARYEHLMGQLMRARRFDELAASKMLWMSNQEIVALQQAGHLVGLHSYSHPTTIHRLSREEQEREYQRNFDHLRDVLGRDPISMSHPCGNYNADTLSILKRLGIRIGFRSNNSITEITSNLEIPRDDHANIYREMRK